MRLAIPATLVVALASSCGGATPHDLSPSSDPRGPITLRLKPGHYRFQLGKQVVVGDKILCTTRDGSPAGGGYVGKPGHGVASSTGFTLNVSPGGRVTVTCPAHPGTV
jgi:hypothetical protein